jgi:hypothetical protein
MPYDYSSIMQASAQRLDAQQAEMVAELEAGRMAEDADRTMYAATRLLEIDAQRVALAERANQYIARQQAQPKGNAYGLSDQELAIAKNSHSGGTVDERLREYASNKQRLQHMRATGQYRDDQGTVRR